MTPRVSIIVPVLNEAAILGDALGALAILRSAGAEACEVIVVDGGSADAHPATRATCAGLADAVLRAPCGRARQMNAGAAQAQGDVFVFLHADTRLPAGAPAAIHAALQRHAWGRFDVRIDGASMWLPAIAAFMNARSRLSGIATGDQAMFVTRAAFAAVGGFPDQPLMEDIELSRRLRRSGAPACLRLRGRTSGRRWDECGVWRTMVLMWRLRWLYWRGKPAEQLAGRYR